MVLIPPDSIDNLNFTEGAGDETSSNIAYYGFRWGGGARKVNIKFGGNASPTTYTKTSDNYVEIPRNVVSIEVTEDGDGHFPGQGYITLLRDFRNIEYSDRPSTLMIRKANRFNWRNKHDIIAKGRNRGVVFYDAPNGHSHGKKIIRATEADFEVLIPKQYTTSMYKHHKREFPTAFLKEHVTNITDRNYIHYVPDGNINHLDLNDQYNKFRFAGGAGKVQMCTKDWNEIRTKCYDHRGPKSCEEFRKYEWES